jgi:hypothetical protein
MATKQIVRRKEVRKDRIYTLRFTEADWVKYEEFCIDEHIKLADLFRKALEREIKQRLKTIQRKKKA